MPFVQTVHFFSKRVNTGKAYLVVLIIFIRYLIEIQAIKLNLLMFFKNVYLYK